VNTAPALPEVLDNLMPLTLDLAKPASETCARAFAEDPTTRYLIPDFVKRPNLRYSIEYYLKLSVLGGGGGAFVTSPSCEGVIVWIESERKELFLNRLRAGWPFLPLRCGWSHLLRAAFLDMRFGRLRQELAPRRHMYPAVLAVDPAYYGQGFASRLMRPMLKLLDEERLPAYLETQNLRNVEMYRRWGFDLLREETMPGADLKLYLMLRQPKVIAC
jgi:ribosomal protein S18 acetylase RimI-like enzyme